MHTRPRILGACLLALLLCGAALAQNPDLQVDWEYTDSGGNLVSGTITISDGATEPLVVEQSELGGTTVTWVLTGVDPTGNDLFPDVGYAVPPNPAGFRNGGLFNLGGPVSLEYTVTADPLNPGDPARVSTCTLAVTVEDTTGPAIASVDCESVPDPIITVTDGDIAAFDDSVGGGRVVDFTASVTDLCDANPTVTYNPASGSTFTVGDTTVTATATDASGNSSQIQFTIRINSLTGPNAPIMVPEPPYSEGTDNEVGWTITDPSTEFTEAQVSDDPTFATVLETYRT
ncbi:MAG: HYR domain-containing protein, partial [Armatimonadia bacterium]|nr:HYR domain-containing protein [Armatimonadia bacterium]